MPTVGYGLRLGFGLRGPLLFLGLPCGGKTLSLCRLPFGVLIGIPLPHGRQEPRVFLRSFALLCGLFLGLGAGYGRPVVDRPKSRFPQTGRRGETAFGRYRLRIDSVEFFRFFML